MFRLWGSEIRAQGSGSRFACLGFGAQGLGFCFVGLGCRVWDEGIGPPNPKPKP